MRAKRVLLAGAACVLLLAGFGTGLTACGGEPATSTSTLPATSALSPSSLPALTTTTTPAPPAPAGTQNATSTTAADELSDSLEYARSLGGIPRKGETLHLVVGASVETEAEAQALLREAMPFFGDMQSYFIVQKSDNFEGMAPGRWIIIEAYDEMPSAENIEFGRRAFPEATVTVAKVLTSDPIPVYEDRLGL